MASPFTFRCFDLVTAAQLDSMPFTKVSWGEQVNAVGSFSATLNLTDPNVQKLNWERATRPNMALIIPDFQGNCTQGFIVTTRKYKDKVLTVAGMTAEQWFTQRIQAVDYSKPFPDAIYWGANPADPTTVAAQVIYDCLQGALTMELDAQYCTIGGNGTVDGTRSSMQILVNGQPPPSIIGGDFTAVVTDSSDQLIGYGLNPGVVVGSEIGDGDVYIPSATNATAVAQESNGPRTASAQATFTHLSRAVTILSDVRIENGELIVATGIPLGTTLSDVASTGGIGYTATLSHTPTADHTNETALITPWFRVTMNNHASVTPTSPISESVAYSVTTGYSPTPEADWISTTLPKNQYQTADEIVTTLAQMGHDVGFDFSVDVSYIPGTTIPQITYNIWYPRQGTSSIASIQNIVGDGTTATVTTYLPHGFSTGEVSSISGNTVTAFNSAYTVTVTGLVTFTFASSYSGTGTGGGAIGDGSNVLTVRRNIVISFEYDEDSTQQQIGIIETASKTGGVITGYVANSVLVSDYGYAVVEGVQTREKVNDATMLKQMAAGDIQLFQNPTATCTIVVPLCLSSWNANGANVGLGDFSVGDDLSFVIDPVVPDVLGNNNDPRFPNGMNFEWRINQYLVTVADDGVSTITFTLGIPPTSPVLGIMPTPPPLS